MAAAGPTLSVLSLLSLLVNWPFFRRESCRSSRARGCSRSYAQCTQCTQFTQFTSLLAFFSGVRAAAALERGAAAGPPLSLLSFLSLLAFFFLREHSRIHEELKRETAEGTAQFAYSTFCGTAQFAVQHSLRV